MPITIQNYMTELTKQAASDLEKAYLNIPPEKRNWSPLDKGRSADNQLAECAMLARRPADTIKNKVADDIDFAQYLAEKTQLAESPDKLLPLLHENVDYLADAIRGLADEDLGVTVQFPWGPMTLQEIMHYPYWNMSYHLGQINYIASLLGCLS